MYKNIVKYDHPVTYLLNLGQIYTPPIDYQSFLLSHQLCKTQHSASTPILGTVTPQREGKEKVVAQQFVRDLIGSPPGHTTQDLKAATHRPKTSGDTPIQYLRPVVEDAWGTPLELQYDKTIESTYSRSDEASKQLTFADTKSPDSWANSLF